MKDEGKAVEICSGCGRLVTAADYLRGTTMFISSNCNAKATVTLSLEDYKTMMNKKSGYSKGNPK